MSIFFDFASLAASLKEITPLAEISLSFLPNSNLELEKTFICGGGAYNKTLIKRIEDLIPSEVVLTNELGISVDWVEAMAFAWMAKQTLEKKKSNEPQVTGASRKAILGGIYHP